MHWIDFAYWLSSLSWARYHRSCSSADPWPGKKSGQLKGTNGTSPNNRKSTVDGFKVLQRSCRLTWQNVFQTFAYFGSIASSKNRNWVLHCPDLLAYSIIHYPLNPPAYLGPLYLHEDAVPRIILTQFFSISSTKHRKNHSGITFCWNTLDQITKSLPVWMSHGWLISNTHRAPWHSPI